MRELEYSEYAQRQRILKRNFATQVLTEQASDVSSESESPPEPVNWENGPKYQEVEGIRSIPKKLILADFLEPFEAPPTNRDELVRHTLREEHRYHNQRREHAIMPVRDWRDVPDKDNHNNDGFNAKYCDETDEVSLTGKAGLTNLGATCYQNSILQALYVTDQYRKYLMKIESEVSTTRALKSTFSKMEASSTTVQTRPFVANLAAMWKSNRQEDASEFAKYLLDDIFEGTRKGDKSVPVNTAAGQILEPNFGGVTRTRVVCNACGSVTKRYQSFIELALWFTDEKTTTTESQLASFLAPEQLQGHNAYQCSSCNELREARKQTSIVRSPDNLMICYKRFAFDTKTLTRRKILTTTACPEILSVPVSIEADPDSKESEEEGKTEESVIKVNYQLYAAVMHSGRSATCGHYYTIGRHSTNPQTWYQFNDSFVSFSSFDAINSLYFTNDVPYLLFYRQIKR